MDLSLTSPAFGVVTVKAGKIIDVEVSSVKTDSKHSMGYRLVQIYNHMQKIHEDHPDINILVREKGFSRFPKVTQSLFRVVAVSDIVAYKNGFKKVYEYSPTTVKKQITGNGKSQKDTVALKLSTNFGINANYENDKGFDKADAVAVAVTHLDKKKALV